MTQLIAPPEITIQTLPYGWKGQQRLAVSLMLATPIDSHLPYSTQDAWNGIMDVIPKAECFDLGYLKPRGEVLVYGSYYAPDGYAITADRVRLKAGNVDKQLVVTGERLWRNLLTPTTPEPFSKLPLTYEHGYGGEEDDRNPIGRGYNLKPDEPMPQLEYPEQLLTQKRQKPMPAGLNATSVDWMPRKKLWGTYDELWQEHDAPFLARDLNPDFFMQAADDQWFESYIQGKEEILLENMHPTQRTIIGTVPEYQFRLLSLINGCTELHSCQPDTLVLMPDINMQVVIARTELPINSIDGSEVEALLSAYENPRESKKTDHYQQHLVLRQSDDISDEDILNYAPMRPSSVKEPLSALKLPQEGKPDIAQPGPATLSALAAAGGFAAKMAAATAKSSGSDSTSKAAADGEASESSSSASPSTPEISSAQAEQAANALKTQLEAMGFTDQQLNDLMQAPPDQVPILINQMLAQLFPDQPQADPDTIETDPVIKEQLDRAGQEADTASKNMPESGNAAIDAELSRTLATPGQSADFNILEPLVEDQLNRVSEELAKLYEVYPGDKSELDQPSDIGSKAIIQLLKGISGSS